MATESAVAEVTETLPEVKTKVKVKDIISGDNVIADTAAYVESLTKTKAINEAERLAKDIETNYFMMGGILKVIKDNSWFEEFEDFPSFVQEKYGFQNRKAMYLISIYDNLVTKQIPWEKVSGLGWTKLKDLAGVLTVDNVDMWVAKAQNVTVAELQAMLKAEQGEGEKTAKTTDDITKMTFKLKPDQADIVQSAIAKAKGELNTEYDATALENICSGYVGGTTGGGVTFANLVEKMGFEVALKEISDMFPQYDINVDDAKPVDGAKA